jgi:hypothetical protein
MQLFDSIALESLSYFYQVPLSAPVVVTDAFNSAYFQEVPELVGSFYNFVQIYACFVPVVFLQSSMLSAVVDTALLALNTVQQTESVNESTLCVVCVLMSISFAIFARFRRKFEQRTAAGRCSNKTDRQRVARKDLPCAVPRVHRRRQLLANRGSHRRDARVDSIRCAAVWSVLCRVLGDVANLGQREDERV